MGDLAVELYGTQVGRLTGTWRSFDFVPSPEGVARFGLDSQVMSVSVPLTVVPTRAHRARRENFFRELLPEGRMLEHLASKAGVAAHDTIELLRRYGRDVAGALQIWDPEAPGEPRVPRSEPAEITDVAAMLRDVGSSPIGNTTIAGKSSLAGVQDKIVLVRTSSGWARAVEGFASTHILKPAPQEYPSTIYAEEYGARFARAVGLSPFSTWIEDFDGVPAVVIERYDRSPHAAGGRVHQEDVNQALAASGNEKYQRYGGRVSLARIAGLLAQLADHSARARLLTMAVLSVALGNLDMHAKNVSLLHQPDGAISLAPAYDVVPQAHLPNDGELALAIDGIYRHADVTVENLVSEGARWGVTGAESLVMAALRAVDETVRAEDPHPRTDPRVREDIARFTQNLLSGRAAGSGPGSR